MITRKCAIQGGPSWVPWSQPNLTSNGTMGGATCACTSTMTQNPVYYAFDSSASTYIGTRNATYELTFYTPTPIKVSAVQVVASNIKYITKAGSVLGSNDRTNWTTLTTYSLTPTSGTVDITVNATEAYKYIKLTSTARYGPSESRVTRMNITATYAA